MNSSRDQQIEALQTALKAARENENRWMEISADFSTDPERIEALLADASDLTGLAQPVCSETVDAKNRMGETA
jgi:hypothetical protein